MNAKQNLKSWLKRNKWYVLIFIVVWGVSELLTNSGGRSLGILLLDAVGFMLLFGIGFLITDYNHKNPHKISAFFKHNLYLIWIILGLIYIIALPFVGIYELVPAHYHLLIILTDVAAAVAFIISFILALLLASYLLRHFRIIYYPKGRRFE